MKKFVLVVIPIILLLGGAYGSKVYMDKRHFNQYVKAAQQDIKQGAWQAAKREYKKADHLHSTAETTAALQQLGYVTKAQKQVERGNKQAAQETMELALYVKHPVPVITKAIKAEVKELDESNQKSKRKPTSKQEKSSQADASSSLPAQSPVEETPSQTTPAVVPDQSQAIIDQGGAAYQDPQSAAGYANQVPANDEAPVEANNQEAAVTDAAKTAKVNQAVPEVNNGDNAAAAS